MGDEGTMGSGDGVGSSNSIQTLSGRDRSKANLLPAWKPGQVPNPKGRTMGARQKLTEKFITDLAANYDRDGMRAIERVAEENPVAYLQIICRLLPKDTHLTISTDLSSALPQDQLKRIAEAWMLSQHDDSVLEGESVVTSDPEQASLPEPVEEPDPVPVRCVDSVPARKGLTASKRPRIDLEQVVDEDE
jgi:hypothetical protein